MDIISLQGFYDLFLAHPLIRVLIQAETNPVNFHQFSETLCPSIIKFRRTQ